MRRSPTAGSDGPASSLSGRRRRSGGDAERAPLLEEAGERRPLRCSISPSCRLVASGSSASVSSRLSLKRLLKRCSAGLSTAGKQSRCWDVPRWWDVCSARVVFLASSISSVISDVCHGIPATALGPRLLAKTCIGHVSVKYACVSVGRPGGRLQTAHGTRVTHRRDARLEYQFSPS